jgi:WD40 repeat protein
MTDVTTGQKTRKIRAHREIINSIDRTMASGSGTELLATGSDDGTVKIWEGGEDAGKQAVATFEVGCPVTSVCWSADGNSVYIGAIDNEVHVRPHVQFLSILPFSKRDCAHRYMTSGKASKSPLLSGIQTRQRR